ncbi:MAG: DUF3307 domain-containing protein [Bacteroidetes bacterium]|nr:DUF3307 domain-containing protein [Bacteroidota bacterium]MBS1628813.1 DUF3307 domain-containing protein [Bacteroidota bacterium]
MDWSLPARLLLAHILGDFLLQPDSWVAHRRAYHFRSSRLYLHVLIHFALATALAFQPNAWLIGLIIAAGHLLFDGMKALLKKEGVSAFLMDQALHLLVIAICCGLAAPAGEFALSLTAIMQAPKLWWLTVGYALNCLLFPTLIALSTAKWRLDMPEERELLFKAGRWIGIIERVLCFSFVLIGQWAAIGFLIAAKSVFRFGDLREGRDKGQTEYMLIGTLLSFGLSIMTGLGIQMVLKQLAA